MGGQLENRDGSHSLTNAESLLPVDRSVLLAGTYTVDASAGVDIGRQTIVIPTYGNYWTVAANHKIRLEISNVDSPYLTPSREPSTTTIANVKLDLPIR